MNATNLAGSRFKKLPYHSRERGLTALLIIEVVLVFVAVPLNDMAVLPYFVVQMMFVLLVIATLVVTWRSRAAAVLVLIAVILTPLGAYVHAQHPSTTTEWLSQGARFLALAALTWVIGGAVFGPGRVTLHRVQGAVVLYLNFALLFFFFYRLLYAHIPDAFGGLPAGRIEQGAGASLLYFSFSTLTTTGFGDITPLHPMARSFANFEAVIGQLYPATLLARLVSLEIEHRRRAKTGATG
jgi:hypothetical protein